MGGSAKSPSPLAPFADNWVGGDIHGLSAYAGTLYGYVPQITGAASALNSAVGQIAGDAGWQGSAAAAFGKAWEKDAVGATALGVMISAAGSIVNTLAVNLANIESALEKAADTAAAHGVPVGAGGQSPQACLANPTAESWRVSYQNFWNECMHQASDVRTQAAAALQKLGAAATQGGTDGGLGPGDYAALFDTLAGFLGSQTRYRAYVASRLGSVKRTLSDTVTAAREEARLADGRFGTWSEASKQQVGGLQDIKSALNDQLAGAQSTENPFSKAWGFSPSDIPAVGTKLEGLAGPGADLARFAGDLPVVDIAAAGAGTYFNAQADMASGMPWYAAYPGEAGGSAAALAAGGWLGGLAGGGTAAGLGALGAGGLGVSLAAGGVGVVAGGVVAYGVGDFAHNLINENWGADIQQNGVIGGIGTGIADSAVHTGQDFVKVGSGIAHGVESVWNSIF
ncbi:MAG TPA: hypothetical protein VG253_16340 [Streptosporangiaceae bacterium]|nr:hypothetical protein [Streptosporangiaceae bacterium]